MVALERNQEILVTEAGDEMAGYSREVAEAICTGVPDDEIWETVNPLLDWLLGFGKAQEEVRSLLQRGENGVRGLHQFLVYLVEDKEIVGGLLEGKVNLLLEAIDR